MISDSASRLGLLPYERVVLEVFCINEPLCRREVHQLAGYSEGTCSRAMAKLRRIGLLERTQFGRFNCPWTATDRGKIAFALIAGRELIRRNARRRQPA